jgi:hypothetical protein
MTRIMGADRMDGLSPIIHLRHFLVQRALLFEPPDHALPKLRNSTCLDDFIIDGSLFGQ